MRVLDYSGTGGDAKFANQRQCGNFSLWLDQNTKAVLGSQFVGFPVVAFYAYAAFAALLQLGCPQEQRLRTSTSLFFAESAQVSLQ
jgi:hypothetical protein